LHSRISQKSNATLWTIPPFAKFQTSALHRVSFSVSFTGLEILNFWWKTWIGLQFWTFRFSFNFFIYLVVSFTFFL
jgi:hypothetical protein